ncbi:Alpha/Beta hydrolase protein [Gamsiella multidivaricata]|uniref:Alpha/Beta hydrolase protein n=1 Tax=Gamsiella multidivaricata TaxID=101098 RepID=UPI00221E9BB0|nr:Alpha/Beta hydrolase protein [Gamsiella multidivaricata]KAI7819517.1 Alpha/Beta hydrolase protein [Gamsiella multidivaricata]
MDCILLIPPMPPCHQYCYPFTPSQLKKMATKAITATEERSFELQSGIVLAAKHWRTAGAPVQARPSRRFLAFHGHLDNANSFDMLAPLMIHQLGPEPVEIVALDLAGHGISSHRQTGDYSFWRYVEDVDQVSEQLGWEKHSVIGHSMGGAISALYAGLFEFRVVLCILLDNFGPFTLLVEDQPQHLLEYIQEKKNLVNKRLPFHPTIESACNARSKGGVLLHPDPAKLLVSRGLRRVERTDEHGNTAQGWTWSTDRLLTIRIPQSISNEYVRAFMSRITCPVLGVLASEGLMTMKTTVDERVGWLQKANVTVKGIPGSHSVHMEDAPLVAKQVCGWILAQDVDRPAAGL